MIIKIALKRKTIRALMKTATMKRPHRKIYRNRSIQFRIFQNLQNRKSVPEIKSD